MSVVVEQIVIDDVWPGLYGESWKGLICDEAFAHPAKFSRALIRRIYDHVVEEGWATKGCSVVDPFGGVALGAFDAMRHGLNWYGCELEMKFVGLGTANILQWENRFSRMPNWGTARLLQGDSRKLAKVLSAAECCVSSPPYAGNEKSDYLMSDDGKTRRRDEKRGFKQGHGCFRGSEGAYGHSEGQLGAMKEGDHSIAISSPPYNLPFSQDHNGSRGGGRSNSTAPSSERGAFIVYGNTPGQLEGMRGDGFEAAVSSPPYEGTLDHAPGNKTWDTAGKYSAQIQTSTEGYGAHADNVGLTRGETFWSASRFILEQLHQVIVPGGHAVFVVKAFVRDKQIVDFPAQWAQLCEAVGFRLLHHHRASLVENGARQPAMDQFDIEGDTWRMVTRDRDYTVARKSFFRRLAEKKGSPRIDHESVLCFQRLA